MSAIADTLRDFGVSADDIARRTGLSIERASALLAGGDASLAELTSLAVGLKLPLGAFLANDGGVVSEATRVLFRSTAQSGPPDISVQRTARFVDAALHVLPPRTSPPAWLAKLVAKEETYQEAERLAQELRSLFYPSRPDDPALDLADVLASEGGIVIGRLRQSQYEGASLMAGGYPFILVSPRFPARMLFTLAHELGHLIAHHNSTPIFERASSIGYGRRRASKGEQFVDAFASLVLLPAGGVAVTLAKIREILAISSDALGDLEILLLARFFGVSFEVAARRCEDLELLPSGGARSLQEQLVQDYRNPERRADAVGLPARPQVSLPAVSQNLLKAIVAKIEGGDVSIGWAANAFGLSVGQINAAHAELTREVRH